MRPHTRRYLPGRGRLSPADALAALAESDGDAPPSEPWAALCYRRLRDAGSAPTLAQRIAAGVDDALLELAAALAASPSAVLRAYRRRDLLAGHHEAPSWAAVGSEKTDFCRSPLHSRSPLLSPPQSRTVRL